MLLKKSTILFYVLFSPFVFASNSVKEVVNDRVSYYFTHSAEKTAEYWAPFSDAPAPVVDALKRYESRYGKPISYDTIAIEEVTPRVSIAFVAVNYEKGVTFLRLQVYLDSNNKWSLMFVSLNPEPFGLVPNIITFSKRFSETKPIN
ncbi:hypothetical protein [Vibrio neonatus]|uniref:hypothetical protein n=1 Tax=Vibrio neonatus TaxID=278860 RepID=UPI0021C2E6E6|nr:hypothetical protein [Vibrio neonatus]